MNDMSNNLHEEILIRAIRKLENEGLKIIRLDRRNIPDAVAIDFQNRKIFAIEAETNPTGIWITKRKYERYPQQYDEEIVVAPRKISGRYKSRKAYELCLELHKSGLSERAIQREIFKRLNEKVSTGQTHNWIAGRSKPITLRI